MQLLAGNHRAASASARGVAAQRSVRTLGSCRVGRLHEEQKQLSVKRSGNDTLLIERIVARWRPGEYA
jgi:hypothetical protein